MKIFIILIFMISNVHAGLGLSAQAAWDSSVALIEGKVVKWKKLSDFSEEGPSDVNVIRTLYWAEVKPSKYLKWAGPKPEKVHIFWFEELGPRGERGHRTLDPVQSGNIVWAFSQFGGDLAARGLMYPTFVPLPKDISDEISKHAGQLKSKR